MKRFADGEDLRKISAWEHLNLAPLWQQPWLALGFIRRSNAAGRRRAPLAHDQYY
jgi:hypothetical protein